MQTNKSSYKGWSLDGSWWHFWVFGGEECHGASDGALSLPIHLPLCIGAIYAGSATRNSNQKYTRQDLEDKMSRNGKQK